MEKHFWLFFLAIFLILMASCSDNGSEKGKSYDPNLPVEATTFLPDSGGIRSKFVVKGSNFGTDISKIQVLFNEKNKATVISSTGDMIYCLVPRQVGGHNKVSVLIDGRDTAKVTNKTFAYTVAQSLSLISGHDHDGRLLDGNLINARFNHITGIGVLPSNNIIVFCQTNSEVRLVSINDNKVVTLSNSIAAGKPAITKDGTIVYAITKGLPHKIYSFEQKNLWAPKRMATQMPGVTGDIWATALDNEEKWLYFRDSSGAFGRVEIANPSNIQILNPNCGGTGNDGVSYLAHNKADDHFYLSVRFYNGIYRISKDGNTVEQYAGFNGFGGANGTRLTASFSQPVGLTFDSQGNLYIADSAGATIREITLAEGIVTTVAGIYNKTSNQIGFLSGDPLKSTFDYPYDISCDSYDNFYIGEYWNYCVRYLAIE